MKIAFVGKGGSGKTTLAALFTDYLVKTGNPVLAIDADINMHMGELLGFKEPDSGATHLSNPDSVKFIRMYLKGNNYRIKDESQFRKTTPPANESNFVVLSDKNPIIEKFSNKDKNLFFMQVGTYDEDGIGASCYHGNLAILENILSHSLDKDGYIVVDMVAGTDAFANTMHSQFDLLVLVIEPTKKGIDVFNQYYKLAKSAGIIQNILVIANKIRNEEDKKFLINNIPQENILGFFNDSDYLRIHERTGGKLDYNLLETENIKLLDKLFTKLSVIQPDYAGRLKKLHELHMKFIGDNKEFALQIDHSFNYSNVLEKYELNTKV